MTKKYFLSGFFFVQEKIKSNVDLRWAERGNIREMSRSKRGTSRPKGPREGPKDIPIEYHLSKGDRAAVINSQTLGASPPVQCRPHGLLEICTILKK